MSKKAGAEVVARSTHDNIRYSTVILTNKHGIKSVRVIAAKHADENETSEIVGMRVTHPVVARKANNVNIQTDFPLPQEVQADVQNALRAIGRL